VQLTDATAEGTNLQYQGRSIGARGFPIGIDHRRITDRAEHPTAIARAADLREALGNPKHLLLGVDRLDYTKGIEVRLRAYLELLREQRLDPEETVMMQIAEPSRSNVHHYAEIRAEIERLVGDINGNFATVGRPAVHYLHQGQGADELVAMYLAADVMLVTPFRDGMNLVAKEYVACRADDTGVLVLSEFAGAAQVLKEAILVNPHDIDGLKRAILLAVNLNKDEQAERMHPLRQSVRKNDAQLWARTFLENLTAQ
ncbi:MAG: trehalose-6-phosphate synthase, partial [Acidimicrobiales bacterium]|nr:trehalose-6-phosphate synthase [Acidimicrobiales bacterium]